MSKKSEKQDENHALKRNKLLRDKENFLNHSIVPSVASFSSLPKSSTKSLRSSSSNSSDRSFLNDENCVSLTTTIAIAYPRPIEEKKKQSEATIHRKKKTVEAAKAHHYLHCNYVIAPDMEATVTDVVMYTVAAKIFVDDESRVVKTWDDGEKIWVAWMQNHQITITMDNITELHNHVVDVTFLEAKDKMSHKARVDKPKITKLPSRSKMDMLEEQQTLKVSDAVATLLTSWRSTQPKESVTDEDMKVHRLLKVEPDASFIREKTCPLAKHQRSDHGNVEMDAYKKQQAMLKLHLSTIEKKASVLTHHLEHAPKTKKKASEKRRKTVSAVHKPKPFIIQVRLESLFSGAKAVTSRLADRVGSMLDAFVSISVDEGSILPTDLEKNLNPLTITLKSVKNLPDTPISQQQLEQTSEPVYCKYDFFGQSTHVTSGRPHGKQVYFEDTHTIFVGQLNEGKLREFIMSNSFQVEVHDRDQHDEMVERMPTPNAADHSDKQSASGLTAGIAPTQNVLPSDENKPFDSFGIAKVPLLDLLRGRTSIYVEVPVTSCPIPEVPKRSEPKDGKEAKLFLEPGTVERPRRTVQLPGHYVEASTSLKLHIKLRYPLVPHPNVPKMLATPQQMCLYSRMIFYFSFKNKEYLRRIDNLIRHANARALGIDDFENDVIDAALSTYKLTAQQLTSVTLDIITGFHLIDGEIHMVVIEGLRGGSIETFISDLKRTDTEEDEILVHLYDTSMTFSNRLYTELDIDLCRVRLHQPISKIMKQSLIYVKEIIPRKCYDCLIKCHQITQVKKLRDVAYSNLFPTHEMVVALAKEFGIPLTYEDFTEHHKAGRTVGSDTTTGKGVGRRDATGRPLSSKPSLHVSFASVNEPPATLVNTNSDFEQVLHQRATNPNKTDHIALNIVAVQEAGKRRRPSLPSIRMLMANAPAHNYGTQALNTAEQAKHLLRKILRDCDPKGRYTYNPDFYSAMISPRCIESVRRKEKVRSKRRWTTAQGFVYPGMKSGLVSNEHPSKPHDSRIKDLKLKFRDNILHRNTMAPTLSRSRLKWNDRAKDFDIYCKPQLDFGDTPSLTIMSAGDRKLMEEKQYRSDETEKWRKKLVVDDALIRFHRLLWMTEKTNDSNQLDRLPGLLKDPPRKHTFMKRPVFNMPALSVVMNPSVDTVARIKGVKLPPAFDATSELNVGFVPGPLEGHSLSMSNNSIPIKDEKHLNPIKSDHDVKPKEKASKDVAESTNALRGSHQHKLPPFQTVA